MRSSPALTRHHKTEVLAVLEDGSPGRADPPRARRRSGRPRPTFARTNCSDELLPSPLFWRVVLDGRWLVRRAFA